jgi:hypothetical protein
MDVEEEAETPPETITEGRGSRNKIVKFVGLLD